MSEEKKSSKAGRRSEQLQKSKPRFQTLKTIGKRRGEKNQALFARRMHFYSQGKGTQGLVVPYPRCARNVRYIRANASDSFKLLLGDNIYDPSNKAHRVILKAYIQTVASALDAYANLVVEVAASYARSRFPHKPKEQGLKMRSSYLREAQRIIMRIAKE